VSIVFQTPFRLFLTAWRRKRGPPRFAALMVIQELARLRQADPKSGFFHRLNAKLWSALLPVQRVMERHLDTNMPSRLLCDCRCFCCSRVTSRAPAHVGVTVATWSDGGICPFFPHLPFSETLWTSPSVSWSLFFVAPVPDDPTCPGKQKVYNWVDGSGASQ